MVQRQFRTGKNPSAELAGIPVAQQNIFPRQGAALVGDAAVLQQANHRRDAHGDARGVQEVSVLLFRHGDALEHQDQRSACGANVDGLIGSV